MIRTRLRGMGVALITPFKSDESVDYEALMRLVDYQVQNNTDFLCVLGTTAETPTLTEDERQKIKQMVIERVGGRIPILLGVGGNNTKAVVETLQKDDFTGVDAILSVVPYYNKPSQEGLYQHYKSVANAISIPLMLYNVPGRTGVNLENHTILRLFNEVQNIYAIKEASGNLEKIIDLNTKAKNLIITSGDDVINYPVLCCGGMGVISVTSNLLPNKVAELTHSILLESNYQKAHNLSNELYAINKALFIESNPLPIKAAMYLSGLLHTLEYRLPLVPPSAENLKILENILTKYEVVK